MPKPKPLRIAKIHDDFPISELESENWQRAEEIVIEKYWSGENAPLGRHFKACLLWSDTAFYIRFEANQNEPLVISETVDLAGKTAALWEKDVCEIFLAPNPADFRRYFEFEVAPTGEWMDLQVYQSPEQRETNFAYNSEIETAAKIEDRKVWMTFKVGWKAFGQIPKIGEIWRGNIFRCVGAGETRGYLAWQPTMTENPNFHVPEKFGEFEFTGPG